jgi:UDP-N-acetylmuramoylalanine--D-glutamate ligase
VSPARDTLSERRFYLHGMGITNRAAARALLARSRTVVLGDDGDPVRLQALAQDLTDTGAEAPHHVHAPDRAALDQILGQVDAVLPTPGLDERHPLFAAAEAAGVAVLSEFDLAGAWDDRPVLAITGTNGKTTVTTLVDAMLDASGVRSAAVGNTEVPLVAALDDPETQVFVVEASSFRLGHSRRFRPQVGTWLNFAEDHLDVHRTLDDYRDAKARIWADQRSDDTAVVNADDPVVAALAPSASDGPRVLRYGLDAAVGSLDYVVRDGVLQGPDGLELVAVDELWSPLPHDRSNALAAAATALAGGATVHGVRSALRSFRGLAHRVQLVAEVGGVRFYDDSKATAPHATRSAIGGFDAVVLIAGGRNKGLDLSVLGDDAPQVRAAVGIGEAAEQVVAAFADRPTATATTMREAVRAAMDLASDGDVVLLSPACASFDWYGSYAERGEDFASEVRALTVEVT